MHPPPTLRRPNGWKRSTEMRFLTGHSIVWQQPLLGRAIWTAYWPNDSCFLQNRWTKISVVDRTNRSASRCRSHPQQLATDVYGRGCVITLYKSQFIAVYQYQHLTRNNTLPLGGKEHQERAKKNKSNLEKLSDRISAFLRDVQGIKLPHKRRSSWTCKDEISCVVASFKGNKLIVTKSLQPQMLDLIHESH